MPSRFFYPTNTGSLAGIRRSSSFADPMMNTERSFAAATAAKPARSRARPMILIVEDSEDGREMMEILLGTKGYDVISAENGLQAVEVALTKFPDLILLDLQLPDLDGLAVTRNLRLHPNLKEVPIVVISGHDPRKYRQPALEAGCTDYLLKPIDFELFDEILNTRVPLTWEETLKCES